MLQGNGGDEAVGLGPANQGLTPPVRLLGPQPVSGESVAVPTPTA